LAFGGGDVWLVLWMCVDGFYLGFKTFKMSLQRLWNLIWFVVF
jgi:hypothetical protein